MNKLFLLIPIIFLTSSVHLQAQSFTLGTSMDGFANTGPTSTATYGGATYERWDEVAANTGTGYLVASDGFSNKWQNSSTPFDSEFTLFFGDGASPNGVFNTAPTIGNTYIFKLRRNGYSNLNAIVMETSAAPVTITGVSQSPMGSPVNAGTDLTITVSLSSAPSAEENVFVRWSNNGFSTYGTLESPSSGGGTSSQQFTISGQPAGVTVNYYVFTTTLSSGTLNGDSPLTDLATIELSNNGGANFSTLFPVEFTDFGVKPEDESANIFWQTATEQNNSHFNIQRSTDSKIWKTLGTVQGHGTTLETQDYTFTDRQPLNGRNYYRLEQVDYDGSTEYSKVVSVDFRKDGNMISFSPNPVSDEINFQFSEDMEGEYFISIFDLNGKIWYSQNRAGNTLDVSALAAGVYFMKIENENGQIITEERFVKK